MASPLSAGDCIAILNLLIASHRALSGTSEDAKALAALRDDLFSLQAILEQLDLPNSTSLPQNHRDQLEAAIARCHTVLSNTLTFLSQYSNASSTVGRYWGRLRFSLGGKTKLEPYHLRLLCSMHALGVVQQDIHGYIWRTTPSRYVSGIADRKAPHRSTLSHVRSDIQNNHGQLVLQIQQATSQVMVVCRGLDDPPDQKPIQFRDALGRRFPVPLEVCAKFEVTRSLGNGKKRKLIASRVLWMS